MNRLSSATWIQINPWRLKLALPWAVLGITFFSNFFPAVMANKPDQDIGSHAGITAMIIFFLVMAAIKPRETFPIILGLSGTRKVFYAASAVTLVVESVGYAIVLYALTAIEHATHSWGVGLHLFDIPFLSQQNPVVTVLTYVAILLGMGFLGMFQGLIHTRWGKPGLYTAAIVWLGALAVPFAVISLNHQWETIGRWFAAQPVPVLVLGWPLLVAAVFAVTGWFVIRRARA